MCVHKAVSLCLLYLNLDSASRAVRVASSVVARVYTSNAVCCVIKSLLSLHFEQCVSVYISDRTSLALTQMQNVFLCVFVCAAEHGAAHRA